jgi:hypothetical protein
MSWEHIVEQSMVGKFGARRIYNTKNTVPSPWEINKLKADYYSGFDEAVTGSRTMTIRNWLRTQTYEKQRAFGIQTLKTLGLTFGK